MDVTVLGVDRRGQRVARRCARRDHSVTLHAEHPGEAMDAIDDISYRFERDGEDADLDATTGLESAAADADVVVETTTGTTDGLVERFARLEPHIGGETLLVTADPEVSVTDVAAALESPERVLGFGFHPVDTELVELTATEWTTTAVRDRAETFVEGLGATVLSVGDTPGLVGERLALAVELEGMRLLDEGLAGVTTVDELLVEGYDHEVGPLERADRAGLDRRLDTLSELAALEDRYQPPDVLEQRVMLGKTGIEAGEGFYVWEDGDPVRPALEGPDGAP
jgi:3-hydroxybutyryl-CoA dehydrogenase